MRRFGMFFQCVQKFFINLILYLGLLALLNVNGKIFDQTKNFAQKMNLSEYTESKAESLIPKLKHQNLAVNFLANQRILNEEEKSSFQSSGLVHLLAVSGAQIIPVCQLMSFIAIQIFYLCFRWCFVSSKLMKVIFYLKNIVVIGISFLMTGLFSCAGALVRVTFLSSINEFLKSQAFLYPISRCIPVFSPPLIRRVVILFCVSFLFGNIFLDYSFLLSSIGAVTLEILSLSLHFFLKKIKMNLNLKKFVQPLLLCLLTSFLISILLYPVSRVSFLLTSFSNILAAPIVTFIITPLSLILIFAPDGIFLHSLMLKIFDSSLGVLNFIAETFQDPSYSLEIPKILLFSYQGKFYLILLLIILFSLSDVIRARDEESLRHFFRKKNK